MASQWMREQESSAAFADYCNAPIEKTAWNSNLKIEWVLRRELVTRILQHAHHLSGQVHDEGWLCQALTYSKKGFGLLNLHIERSTVLAIAQSDWPAPRPHWQVSGCHVVAKDTLSIEKPRTEPASLNLSVWLRVPIPGSSTAVLLDRSNREQAQAEIDALKSFCVFTDRRGDTCRIVNSYDSRQEAVEAAIRLAAHAPRRQIWQPDKVESSCCVRIGPDQRGGADVSAAQVMKSLGLRGLNFGNWISSTRERQWHLNQVQDAVHDLALLIGVPPAWLGQWGTLGLAVGAQGKGLSRAAGHFVAGIDEINLTRRRGIGVLAHELGHFVDHIAARMLGGE